MVKISKNLKILQTKYSPKFTGICLKQKDKNYFFLKYDVKLLRNFFFNTVSDVKITKKGISLVKSELSLKFTYHKHNIRIVLFVKTIVAILRYTLVH